MCHLARAILVSAVVLGASPASIRAQGIPVIDVSSIAQAIQQLQQMQQQYQQLQQTHQSFNKLTNMNQIAGLLNNPAVRKALPSNFSSAHAAMMGDGGSAAQFKQQDLYYTPPSSTAGNYYQAEVERRQNETAGQKSVAQQMYDAASKRIDELTKLNSQIGQSEDPKTVMDLQARLQFETAAANTDIIRMQALAMLAHAQQRVDEQRREQMFEKSVDDQIRLFQRQ